MVEIRDNALLAQNIPPALPFTTEVKPPKEVDPSADAQETLMISSEDAGRITNQNILTLQERQELAQQTIEASPFLKKIQEENIADRKAREKAQADAQKQATAQQETDAELQAIAGDEGARATGERGSFVMNPNTGIQQFFRAGEPIVFDDPVADVNEAINNQALQFQQDFDALQQRSDAITNALIQSIQAKMETRRAEQRDINKRTLASLRTAGFRRGTARFAPELNTTLLSAQESANLQKIKEIDALELELITQARSAQFAQDFELLNTKVEAFQQAQKDKQTAINKQMELALKVEQLNINKAREQRLQMAEDLKSQETLAENMAITVLAALEEIPEGTNVFEFIDNIATNLGFSNSSFLIKAVNDAQNQQTQDELKTLNITSQISSRAIRDQIASATLDIKRQELEQGLTGLSPKKVATALQITSKITADPVYKDMLDINTGLLGVFDGLSQDNGFGDIAAINSFQRMIDPGATVRSEDVVLLQSATSFFEKLNPAFQIKKLKEGDKLPEAVREQMRVLSKELYETRRNNYENLSGEKFKRLTEAAGIDFGFVGAEFLPVSELLSTIEGFSGVSGIESDIGFMSEEQLQELRDLGLID